MTINETTNIIKRIKSLYSTQTRQFTNSDWQVMIDTWHEQFKADSYEDINRALSAYVNMGKQFMPNAPDIINELINIEEPNTRKLFERLCKEADIVANGIEHITIDDLGGIRKDETSPTGYRYVVAESHVTRTYSQADFAMLPIEIQIYADDIEGLKALHREIESNKHFAYRRFKERMPYVKQEIEERRQNGNQQ